MGTSRRAFVANAFLPAAVASVSFAKHEGRLTDSFTEMTSQFGVVPQDLPGAGLVVDLPVELSPVEAVPCTDYRGQLATCYQTREGFQPTPQYRGDIREFVTGSAQQLLDALTQLAEAVGDDFQHFEVMPSSLGNLALCRADPYPWGGGSRWYVGYYDINLGTIVLYDGVPEHVNPIALAQNQPYSIGAGDYKSLFVSHEGTVEALNAAHPGYFTPWTPPAANE